MVDVRKGIWTHQKEGSYPQNKTGEWGLYKKKNTDRRENGSNGNLKRSKSEKKLDRKHYEDYNDLKIRKTEEWSISFWNLNQAKFLSQKKRELIHPISKVGKLEQMIKLRKNGEQNCGLFSFRG